MGKRETNTVKRKHPVLKRVLLILLALIVMAFLVFSRFGGFGTGKSADVNEFKKYAHAISSITIPEETRIVALGEATHGNSEFQQLKLDVFKLMVEEYGIRAFALESDCGCSETANRYIHGGEGTAIEAASALGFQIYRTQEMADLLSWMREYNETAAEGEDLRFYGFDMQRYEDSYNYLLEAAGEFGVDTSELDRVWDGEKLNDVYNNNQRAEVIKDIKAELEAVKGKDTSEAVHFADVILQNIEMGKVIYDSNGNGVRDKLMAENVMWILAHEEARGNERIFVSAHNGHVNQFGSYDENYRFMGRILADELEENRYFVIGTEFYKTKDNLPVNETKCSKRTFYSHDPLSKAAKKCGYDMCWVDFSEIPEDSPLYNVAYGYCWTGSLGEVNNTFLNSLFFDVMPWLYREWSSPASTFDGVIYVANAHPTDIIG